MHSALQRWPWVRRTVFAVVLVLPPVATGCRTDAAGPATARSHAPTAAPARRAPSLPKPYALPTQPRFALYAASPATIRDLLAPWLGISPADAEVGALLLAPVGRSALAEALAPHVDVDQPFGAAYVEGELVFRVPVRKDAVEEVAARLAKMPAVGQFGARTLDLPPDAEGEILAAPDLVWLDRRGPPALVFARTLRGLATAPHLAEAYGTVPTFATWDRTVGEIVRLPEGARPLAERVTITADPSTGAADLQLDGVDPGLLEALDALVPGRGIAALLPAESIAFGATGAYRHAADAVGEIAASLTAQASEMNFLVRGTAMDMVRRINATLRTWNGEVFVGAADPAPHLLAGFGTDDPARSERAVLHMVAGLADNVSLLRTLGLDVPAIRLRKRIGRVGQTAMHEVVIQGARAFVEPAVHGLLAGADARIAIAFPASAGAGIVVVGPEPVPALEALLADLPSGDDHTKVDPYQVLAMKSRLDPTAVREAVATAGDRLDPLALVSVPRIGAPLSLQLRRTERTLQLSARLPALPRRVQASIVAPVGSAP
ncbi:MAG: hypothetical protein D6705_10230 [Deltaproteobacteria bacterium]|nr:MAG: hypothetical protein D6705_10230 [Deltaproteobacteria bacterium]